MDLGINEPITDSLGPAGFYACAQCNRPISNGRMEWDDKSLLGKSAYLLRTGLTIVFWSALWIFFLGILFFVVFPDIGRFIAPDNRLDSAGFLILAALVFATILIFVVRGLRSKITASRMRQRANVA